MKSLTRVDKHLCVFRRVAPLQARAPSERACSTVDSWVRKYVTIFHRNYGRLAVQTLTPSIGLQDLGLHAGARIGEASRLCDLAHVLQRLVNVNADFKQTSVAKTDQSRNRLYACVQF